MNLFWPFPFFVILLFITGFYCIFASFNLIRVLIGIEILIKAVTLLLVAAGFVGGHAALTQSLVITLIVVEVVVMVVATGVIIGIHTHYGSLNTKNIKTLKG